MNKLTKEEEQEILSKFAQYLKDKQDGKHDLGIGEMAWVAASALFIAMLLSKIPEWL